MTKKSALELAISTLTANGGDSEAIGTLTKMVAQLSKERTPLSDEARAKVNAKRKEATAQARATLVETVAPVIRKYLVGVDVTAKALFDLAEAELPSDFSVAKLQNVLLREMRSELVITEAKGKPNTYRLA